MWITYRHLYRSDSVQLNNTKNCQYWYTILSYHNTGHNLTYSPISIRISPDGFGASTTFIWRWVSACIWVTACIVLELSAKAKTDKCGLHAFHVAAWTIEYDNTYALCPCKNDCYLYISFSKDLSIPKPADRISVQVFGSTLEPITRSAKSPKSNLLWNWGTYWSTRYMNSRVIFFSLLVFTFINSTHPRFRIHTILFKSFQPVALIVGRSTTNSICVKLRTLL